MRVFFILLFVLYSFVWSYGTPAQASEAQAALCLSQKQVAYAVPDDLTAQEKKWFVRFQEGNLLVSGWQDIMSKILQKTPPDKVEEQKKFLKKLGNKIGLEWCRANGQRKVSNEMLKIWGKRIKKAAREDHGKLQTVLASIDQEVDLLLN